MTAATQCDPALLGALRLHLAELTPHQRRKLARAFGGCAELSRATGRDAVARGAPEPLPAALHAVPPDRALRERDRANASGVTLVARGDPAFPPGLLDLHDPPHLLWVRGALPDPSRLAFAVVGPRRPTSYGLAVTRRIAADLAEAGAVVLSGGARGVDGEAHDAALCARGTTVAVLGCGVDVAYPREHRRLFERIVESGGAVASEHPLGTTPRPHHFPVRNRLLAGWARAVLVAEATFQSGSLITARLAVDLGRDVLAVPGPITSRASEGTNDLIATGARVLRGLADVVDELRPDERLLLGVPAPAPRPSEPILDALADGPPLPLDGLAERCALPAGDLLSRLIRLEAAGHVRSLAGGLWQRC
jgi:DNA processing protein